MKNTLIISIVLVFRSFSYAQTTQNPGFGNTGAQAICNQLEFTSDEQVNNLVNKILDYAGVENRSYEIRGCSNITGCFATVKDNQQYIVYQPDYLNSIKSYDFSYTSLPNSDNDWQALTILAHEVGHLINSHFYNCRQDLKPWDKELQADEFAGRIIYKMGGTLEQALSIYNTSIVSVNGSVSHPPRETRKDSVTAGYRKAENPGQPVFTPLVPPPSPIITFPQNGASVGSTGIVEGYSHYTNKKNVYVIITINGTDFLQPQTTVGTNGVWSTPVTYGNSRTPSGSTFRIRSIITSNVMNDPTIPQDAIITNSIMVTLKKDTLTK